MSFDKIEIKDNKIRKVKGNCSESIALDELIKVLIEKEIIKLSDFSL